MRTFLLNGPPRVGKDTAGKLLAQMLGGTTAKFAAPLKMATHAMMAMLRGDKRIAPVEHYDDCKDEPHEDFFGRTPREVYIEVSERLCKPLFGDGFFGDLMIQRLDALTEKGVTDVVITDSGFEAEAEAVKAYSKVSYVLQMHRDDLDFEGDSRGYLAGYDSAVNNSGNTASLRTSLAKALEFIGVE